MEKIMLIGIPNCGKSTLGRRLAEVKKLSFFDTDQLLTEKIKSERVSDFFRLAFNGQFLDIQRKIMEELNLKKCPAIISTGAEVALIPECAALMKKMGTIIHIQRDPELALENMRASGKTGNVMVKNGKKIDMNKEEIRLYMEDYPQYVALANLTLDNNGTEDEGLEKLMTMLAGIKLG
jgi:shikimate kinase